jgi:PEGA domain
MNILNLLALVGLGLLCANCATVTRGTTNQMQIQSEPTGADVATSLGHRCTTPCTLTIDRKSEFTVGVSKPGYRLVETPVRVQIAGAGAAGFAGNIIVGGVVGMVADAATGATLEHTPNPLTVTLTKIAPATDRPRGRSPGRGTRQQPLASPAQDYELPPIPAAPKPLEPGPTPTS